MLIIANGAFKSGSTWQRNIIRHFMELEELPEEFRSAKYDSFVDYDKLREIVHSEKISKHDYLAKAHIYKKEYIDILTENKTDVKVLMIRRDIRDAIVSHYNHFINVRKFKPSFAQYYWTIGRFKAMQILKYNHNWKEHNTNVLHTTFESMKADVSTEIKKLAQFLGVELTDEQVEKIKADTNINKVRAKSDRKWFYRKGEIGDHKNYLTPAIEKDLRRIENKFSAFDEATYYLLFELRYAVGL